MLIGVYGDVHLSKNMRTFQYVWDDTSTKSIYNMYDKFDEMNVESAICLGDFFDAPRIEAKHMQLVLPILRHMNERTYPTYLLLGNHEIDSDESNILDFLSMYENIIPVTEVLDVEGMLFLPYGTDPSEVDMKDKIVFTHHDIYGSELAGGKTKAFFGIDTSVFSEAALVMNGHVHLRSMVADNIINTGSLLISQQGEMRVGEYPQYYIVDKNSVKVDSYDNKYSMIYLTARDTELNKIIDTGYDRNHLVLKLEYEGELKDNTISALHTSYRKLVTSISNDREDVSVKDSNFDLKSYLVDYITKDSEVPDNRKSEYIKTVLEELL